jgi:hypothetical protein
MARAIVVIACISLLCPTGPRVHAQGQQPARNGAWWLSVPKEQRVDFVAGYIPRA